MRFSGFHHQPKSSQAYLFDKDHVHLRFKTPKDKKRRIEVIHGDPFLHVRDKRKKAHEWNPCSQGDKMELEAETADHFHYFLSVAPPHKRLKYAFLIDGRYLCGAYETIDVAKNPDSRYDLSNYFAFPYMNEEDLFSPPSWLEDANFYSIFPERFKNADASLDDADTLPWDGVADFTNKDRFGGDLKGGEEKLPYIKKLGMDAIYLTPVFTAMSTHKYDTVDYHTIDPSFGTNEDFARLVEKAHGLGLKVILDGVFNHTGLKHPFFLDVLKRGKKSPYYGCFHIKDEAKPLLPVDIEALETLSKDELRARIKSPQDINYHTFAFNLHMPKTNPMHPLMKEYFLGVARFWIEAYDIDGWRLDVANEIPHAFWRAFRKTVKDAKAEAVLIGENWDDASPWLQGDQFDSVMNYGLLPPVWRFFGTEESLSGLDAESFIRQVNAVFLAYPKHVTKNLYNLIDSHDTKRIMTVCGEDVRRVRLAYLFLFSAPGAPSIFYGGEVGLAGEDDPKNRRCMPWKAEKRDEGLLAYIQRLAALRKEEKVFSSFPFTWLKTEDGRLLAYRKGDLLFLLNVKDEKARFSLPADFRFQEAKELLSQRTLRLEGTLELEAFEGVVLR